MFNNFSAPGGLLPVGCGSCSWLGRGRRRAVVAEQRPSALLARAVPQPLKPAHIRERVDTGVCIARMVA